MPFAARAHGKTSRSSVVFAAVFFLFFVLALGMCCSGSSVLLYIRDGWSYFTQEEVWRGEGEC